MGASPSAEALSLQPGETLALGREETADDVHGRRLDDSAHPQDDRKHEGHLAVSITSVRGRSGRVRCLRQPGFTSWPRDCAKSCSDTDRESPPAGSHAPGTDTDLDARSEGRVGRSVQPAGGVIKRPRRLPRWPRLGTASRTAQMSQDAFDDAGVLDERHEPQPAAASGALQHVDPKRPPHEIGPSIAVATRPCDECDPKPPPGSE